MKDKTIVIVKVSVRDKTNNKWLEAHEIQKVLDGALKAYSPDFEFDVKVH